MKPTTHGREPGGTDYTWKRARWNRLHMEEGQVKPNTHGGGPDGTDYT